MRLSLRFILPLALVIGLIAYNVVPLVEKLTLKWFIRDIDIRAKLIANTIEDTLVPLVQSNAKDKIAVLFTRITQDERLYAVGFCDQNENIQFSTVTLPAQINCGRVHDSFLQLPQGPLHVAHQSIEKLNNKIGTLILVHDMSFVVRRSADTKRYIFIFFVCLATIISLLTVLIAKLSWRGWIKGIRALLTGERILQPIQHTASPELKPIAKDLRLLIRDLQSDRKTRDESQISWRSHTLKDILRRELAGNEILIVSNREPYIHIRRNDKIHLQVPASGVVTALEPIMRACSGTWIAHGSGNADREVVDRNDHIKVPPTNPSYQLRRVWLTPEEEAGYYYGFSNEGLWPLCHIAHNRPTFRSQDWQVYVDVNRKFAEVAVKEANTEDPVILVQDYHFALLPKMIKEILPKATILTFWHIPWPNPEAFGICPWRNEILEGLLGSSILGFHTRFHCNNFLDTVDRYLESRIDQETSTISYGERLTAVNHYPISIEYPSRWLNDQKPISDCRATIRTRHQLPIDHFIGIGVDRLDYTKGILERFMAVERLLELQPQWQGKFSFIQIAAPSRSVIRQYQHFEADVRAMAERINARFGKNGYMPIILKVEHHEPDAIFEYYRAAELCFVSSLHDGMNLVAKEYVAARDDERGVLILSQFTGAARELPESLIVNPYNIDQCAMALHVALGMSEREQHDRMRSMRGLIQEFNVYRWAGKMLIDAARIRKQKNYEISLAP